MLNILPLMEPKLTMICFYYIICMTVPIKSSNTLMLLIEVACLANHYSANL